jgi:hypothetical protein
MGVGIDLKDFTNDEIAEEYTLRGLGSKETANQLYYAVVMGKPTDDLIREFIYQSIGRII